MKVLFTHGYFIEEDEKEQQIMRPYPPLGLLYLSAYLNEYNIDNEVFDSTFSSKQKLYDRVAEIKPDVVALYANLMTKVNNIEIMTMVRQLSPNTKIVMGGPDVTYNVEAYLNHGADYIIIGEGECTMQELCAWLEKPQGDAPKEIDGLAFLENGEVHKTKARTKVRELDELPIPNRDAIDLHKYTSVWKEKHGESALNISTQRGCPYTCKWCSTAVYGQSYRRRSPENVVQEIIEIQTKYRPDTLWFVDDVFTVSHKWLKEFVEALESAKVKIRFECISRADRMNEEVIDLLHRAGCMRIWIGAESGSQKIIDAMDRRVSVQQVREMIQKSTKKGIQTGTFIMLGYPGETMDDIKETIHHLKVSDPDLFTITLAYPIKGTSFYDEVSAVTTTQPEWSKSTDREIDFKRTYSRKFYDYALTHVVNEVNYDKLKRKDGVSLGAVKLKLKSEFARLRMHMNR